MSFHDDDSYSDASEIISNIVGDMTEEEAMQIWLRRDREIAEGLQRERQIQLEQNRQSQHVSNLQPLLGGLAQHQQRTSMSPSSSIGSISSEDRPPEIPAARSCSAEWRAALSRNAVGPYDPAHHDAWMAYQRFIDMNRPGMADAYIPSTPGLARLVEQQRAEDRRRREEQSSHELRQEEIATAQLREAYQRQSLEARQGRDAARQGYHGSSRNHTMGGAHLTQGVTFSPHDASLVNQGWEYAQDCERREQQRLEEDLAELQQMEEQQRQVFIEARRRRIVIERSFHGSSSHSPMGGAPLARDDPIGRAPLDQDDPMGSAPLAQDEIFSPQDANIIAQIEEYERLSQAHRDQTSRQQDDQSCPLSETHTTANGFFASTNSDDSKKKKDMNMDDHSTDSKNKRDDQNMDDRSDDSKKKKDDQNMVYQTIRAYYSANPSRTQYLTKPVKCSKCFANLYTHPLAQNFCCHFCCQMSLVREDVGNEWDEKMADPDDGEVLNAYCSADNGVAEDGAYARMGDGDPA